MLRIERPAQLMFAGMMKATGVQMEAGQMGSFHADPELEATGDLLMPSGIRKFANQCGQHVLQGVAELEQGNIHRLPIVLNRSVCGALEWIVAGSPKLLAVVVKLAR